MATVLVIDDDTALLAACRVGLRPCHQVRTVATGDAGLSDAAVYPPAVVVLDLGLPDMDGMQVFHQLRGWTQIPVIILSADGSEDRKVEALNGGADDYVTKPFGMRELDARLRVGVPASRRRSRHRPLGIQFAVGIARRNTIPAPVNGSMIASIRDCSP